MVGIRKDDCGDHCVFHLYRQATIGGNVDKQTTMAACLILCLISFLIIIGVNSGVIGNVEKGEVHHEVQGQGREVSPM